MLGNSNTKPAQPQPKMERIASYIILYNVVGLWRVNKRTPELCQEQVGRYTLDASMLGSRFYAVRSVLRPHHRPEGERAGPTIHGFYMEHRALTAHCRQLAGERLLERARPQFLQSSLHRVSIAGLQATLRLLSLWSANCPPLYWRKLWGGTSPLVSFISGG